MLSYVQVSYITLCMDTGMYEFIHAFMPVCMYAHACVYVHTYMCMFVTHLQTRRSITKKSTATTRRSAGLKIQNV